MKKLKKYVLMIPLLAVMLLNCVCYGQVIFSANAIDYNEYFKSPDESDLLSHFDFTDPENVISTVKNYYSNYSASYFTNYYYCVYLTSDEYNKYSSGSPYNFTIKCIFTDSFDITNSTNFYILNKTRLTIDLNFSSSNNFTLTTGVDDHYDKYFIYYKNTGSFVDENTSGIKYIFIGDDRINFCDNNIYYYQYSNIDNFPLFYDYEASLSAMNVNVTFSPELTGAFNRTVTDRGQKVTLDEFSFTVENNSKFDVQYLMAIYRDGDSFLPFNSDPLAAQTDTTFNGKTFTGSAVYVYVKDEWLYLPHGQQGIITGYAPSSWHLVSSGSSDLVSINFNQLKLEQFTNYNVCVYAVRNDLNYVTPFTNLNTFQYPACNDYHIELDNMQKVYSSSFTIINPATFDPNNNENSYAYDEDDRLLFNRANGYIDDNGDIVIDKVDTNQWVNAGNDPDDPWRGWDSDNDAWESYYKNQNTVSSDIDQLSNNFSSFFKFVNKVFSYFPKNYQNIIMLGLTSIVVLAVIKVVF